jgi:hypothetical protein
LCIHRLERGANTLSNGTRAHTASSSTRSPQLRAMRDWSSALTAESLEAAVASGEPALSALLTRAEEAHVAAALESRDDDEEARLGSSLRANAGFLVSWLRHAAPAGAVGADSLMRALPPSVHVLRCRSVSSDSAQFNNAPPRLLAIDLSSSSIRAPALAVLLRRASSTLRVLDISSTRQLGQLSTAQLAAASADGRRPVLWHEELAGLQNLQWLDLRAPCVTLELLREMAPGLLRARLTSGGLRVASSIEAQLRAAAGSTGVGKGRCDSALAALLPPSGEAHEGRRAAILEDCEAEARSYATAEEAEALQAYKAQEAAADALFAGAGAGAASAPLSARSDPWPSPSAIDPDPFAFFSPTNGSPGRLESSVSKALSLRSGSSHASFVIRLEPMPPAASSATLFGPPPGLLPLLAGTQLATPPEGAATVPVTCASALGVTPATAALSEGVPDFDFSPDDEALEDASSPSASQAPTQALTRAGVAAAEEVMAPLLPAVLPSQDRAPKRAAGDSPRGEDGAPPSKRRAIGDAVPVPAPVQALGSTSVPPVLPAPVARALLFDAPAGGPAGAGRFTPAGPSARPAAPVAPRKSANDGGLRMVAPGRLAALRDEVMGAPRAIHTARNAGYMTAVAAAAPVTGRTTTSPGPSSAQSATKAWPLPSGGLPATVRDSRGGGPTAPMKAPTSSREYRDLSALAEKLAVLEAVFAAALQGRPLLPNGAVRVRDPPPVGPVYLSPSRLAASHILFPDGMVVRCAPTRLPLFNEMARARCDVLRQALRDAQTRLEASGRPNEEARAIYTTLLATFRAAKVQVARRTGAPVAVPGSRVGAGGAGGGESTRPTNGGGAIAVVSGRADGVAVSGRLKFDFSAQRPANPAAVA